MHVDLVRNDWSLRIQVCLGRVAVVGDDLIAKDVPTDFVELVDLAVSRVHPVQTTEDRLRELHRLVTGTHIFFTEPHDDEGCPFFDTDSLAMSVEPFVEMPA